MEPEGLLKEPAQMRGVVGRIDDDTPGIAGRPVQARRARVGIVLRSLFVDYLAKLGGAWSHLFAIGSAIYQFPLKAIRRLASEINGAPPDITWSGI
jgi:hypothetical protein